MAFKKTIPFLSILFILPLLALLSIMVIAQDDTAMNEEDDIDTGHSIFVKLAYTFR